LGYKLGTLVFKDVESKENNTKIYNNEIKVRSRKRSKKIMTRLTQTNEKILLKNLPCLFIYV